MPVGEVRNSLLRRLQLYIPTVRGQHVLIWVEDSGLFGNGSTIISPEGNKLTRMKELCAAVNDMWHERNKDHVAFDEENKLALPNPNDVNLEVVMVGHSHGTKFTPIGPAFQILTKKWVSVMPLPDGNGYYSTGEACVPV